MLQELIIQDFAIIKQVDIQFHNGLNALTGETGAGKSIILDAVSLLLGQRARSEAVRQGCSKAVIQGLFIWNAPNQKPIQNFCEEQGWDFKEQSLIIKRELHSNGRNLCRVNDQLVTAGTLKELGRLLVDISGQNQSQSLLDPKIHTATLDQFGAQDLGSLQASYQVEYQKYQQLQQQARALQTNQQQQAQQIDILQFQVQEITAANLQVGEEEQLQAQQQQLANFVMIHDNLQSAYQLLAQSPANLVDRLAEVVKLLQKIAPYAPEYEQLTQVFQNSYYDLQDSQEQLAQKLELQDYDPTQLPEIEQRLQVIRNLEKKYGADIAAVLAFGDQAQQQLEQLQAQVQDPQALERKLAQQTEILTAAAQKITQIRTQIAHRLERKVAQQLRAMYMAHTEFKVRLIPTKFTIWGQERVEFYLRTNLGTDFQPLVQIASGGELARIMLALKTVLAQYQPVGTLIFDEIDTGVSGRVAQAIGEKMAQIAQQIQVLCITHLPQVAAVSDKQYLVAKQVQNQSTRTTIQILKPRQRVEVIAEMLEGTKVTAITKQHAHELLKLAHPQLDLEK
ncbi:DNA repair protein RecN [Lactobacillus sp. DCY120]|uniref:DNA repair protein RecN n=1 Tax=Bombilactobacillus apium TaxID=2675299 RepID=A0A850R1H4_9LACO|nr:DNA repair protein RecN [Bombilactobacillus apium]NVY96959.1 DNA repair protein RecN [Bombilactobacillus apium]